MRVLRRSAPPPPEARTPVMRFLWICLGGALGTGARYLLGGWLHRPGEALPYGTLCANVIGSFLLGLVMAVALSEESFSPTLRLSLTVGFLGGFTTYSTFNYETLERLRSGAWGLAGLYLALTLLGCLLAGFLGMATGRLLAGR